jgi:serine/threonine protein phosphatase PrpC
MSWVRTPVADVFVVLDGMGGHAGGGMAAELAAQVLQRHFEAMTSIASTQTVLRNAFYEANEMVHARGQMGDPATQGMGTTAVALVAVRSRIMLAHVGDSRAYLMTRMGRLRGLTKDHSRVQRMVDAGMLTQAQAANHPDAGILERALGHAPQVEVALSKWLRVRTGDMCLLCSDGLCGYVAEADIATVLSGRRTPQEHADELVKLALDRGGADNVTVQVIRYEGYRGGSTQRWFGAWVRSGATAFASVVFLAAMGIVWIASLPAHNESDRALVASTAALESSVRRDRELADARYASIVQELSGLHARLDQLDKKAPPANAPTRPEALPAQKPSTTKSSKDTAIRPLERRSASARTHGSIDAGSAVSAVKPEAAPAQSNPAAPSGSGS